MFWRQRAKQLWLQAGDKNSKYFHTVASKRRRNNQIHKLLNDDGVWCDWENGLRNLMQEYFSKLFSFSESNWQEVIDYVPSSISTLQNDELLKSIDTAEVRRDLFQMHPDKSPGPDRMTPAIFQKHWKIVGQDIVDMVRKFFRDGQLNSELNATNIVLIPKKKNPATVRDLRPMSLCNVLIKIMTKVIVNRMKSTLECVILLNQSVLHILHF